MKIENIEFKNFRSIKNLKIDLLSDLNIFVGINGSGKSTVLDAIAICLSWLVNRIQRENVSGRHILESSIKNETQQSTLTLKVNENHNIFKWKLIKSVKGFPSEEKSQLRELSELASIFQEKYQHSKNLPMIVYYSINRVTEGILPAMKGKTNIYDLDIYNNALGSKANFQSFFEWFKLQDDILNEQSSSRTKWMIQHKNWIKKRVLKIFSIFPNNEQNEEFNDFKQKLEFEDYIFEEPTFLFREFMYVVEHIDLEYFDEKSIPETFRDLDYLLYQLGKLLDTSRISKMTSSNFDMIFFEKVTNHIFKLIRNNYISSSYTNAVFLNFIWDLFLFSTLLIVWWFSAQGKRNIEKIFREYSPFNNKSDIFNNSSVFIELIRKNTQNENLRFKEAPYRQVRNLMFVTKTIEKFIPEYSNIRIKRVPRPHMLLEKKGKTISLDQLSDGEKNMIAMIGDISRRLSMANPTMKNPLNGNGIILIDEIDLHLHPSWQRKVIPSLNNTFPNCQFIITTHSPQILSHSKAKNIFILKQEKNNLSVIKVTESYGKNSDRLLEDILGVEARPIEIKNGLKELFKIINDGDLSNARLKIAELDNLIEGFEPELLKANALIKRREILGK
ncbi:MAG: AAA family ATPase [Candidatus Cloacimonetes bacterium]|nr:AAA family ATPase [Candidatus Cloacimonadota bacterium]